MNDDFIISLGQQTMRVSVMLAGPLLISALVVGLLVSVFQAVTQINEATLTFIPKIIIIGVVLLLAGPWMLDVLSQYTIGLYENLSTIVRE